MCVVNVLCVQHSEWIWVFVCVCPSLLRVSLCIRPFDSHQRQELCADWSFDAWACAVFGTHAVSVSLAASI